LTAVACILAASLGASARRPDAAAAIAAEAARIGNRSDALGSQADAVTAGLGRVNAALAKERILLALDELQEPWTTEAAMAWAQAHAAIKTPAAFAAEWQRVGEPAWLPPAAGRPAAVEALAAANASRAPATWRASLPYSEDAGIDAGVYYLGEAQAYAAFAAFARSLPLEARGRAPAFRSLASEIAALEAQVAGTYDKAPADVKPRFIRVSIGLKVARTLDEHKDYGAALYQYLAAQYRAAVAVAGDTDPGDVKTRLDAVRARLAPGEDHSIAEMFLERAGFLLETNEPAAARSAAIIADTIVPSYLELVRGSTTVNTRPAPEVTVTLVRWPFT
jgi:hypothetical protein